MKNKSPKSIPAIFILLGAIFAASACSERASEPKLEKTIEQYIRSHPEIVEEALNSLEAKRLREKEARIKQAILDNNDQLLHDPDSPIGGNPSGDVNVVEFFDYRCSYCKRVAPLIKTLQQQDSGVRIVYKEFPILGNTSIFAARAALAARAQGKYQAFHEAMFAFERDMTEWDVLSIAELVGLDRKKLEQDMLSPTLDNVIRRNRALATALSISGTPGFIIGEELYPGALSIESLKQLIAKARGR